MYCDDSKVTPVDSKEVVVSVLHNASSTISDYFHRANLLTFCSTREEKYKPLYMSLHFGFSCFLFCSFVIPASCISAPHSPLQLSPEEGTGGQTDFPHYVHVIL